MRKHDYSERIHGGLIKKAQHRWRCVPCYVLTQGSLHYRLATLGYQKQNSYGVRLSHELPLRPLFLLTRDEIKKTQRRRYYASVSMSESIITNITTTQRRRCCSFDSPGLARNEPTLGKRLQGDSTPSVLSFFHEGMVIARGFMEDYA